MAVSWKGLRDASLLARKAVFEKQFKAAAKAKNLPADQLKTWDEIAASTAQLRTIFKDANYLAPSERTMGELMTFANIATQYSELLASRPQDAERAKALDGAANGKEHGIGGGLSGGSLGRSPDGVRER